MAPRKDERLTIAPLSEYYEDLLTLDAWIAKRSKALQGNSLLCAKLQEREGLIKERITYLASKRGISPDELWRQVLRGEAEEIEPEDIVNPE